MKKQLWGLNRNKTNKQTGGKTIKNSFLLCCSSAQIGRLPSLIFILEKRRRKVGVLWQVFACDIYLFKGMNALKTHGPATLLKVNRSGSCQCIVIWHPIYIYNLNLWEKRCNINVINQSSLCLDVHLKIWCVNATNVHHIPTLPPPPYPPTVLGLMIGYSQCWKYLVVNSGLPWLNMT